MANKILLNNVSDDVVGTAIFTSLGGPAVITVRATDYGTATVSFQRKVANDPDSRYATMEDGAFTADNERLVRLLAAGDQIRAVVTGSTGAEDAIFASIDQ